MATPATITSISRVRKSAKNGKFYLFGAATVAGQQTVLGQSADETVLVNIQLNTLADSIKNLMTQDENDADLFIGNDDTKGLDIAVNFRSMEPDESDDGTMRYWCTLA